MAVQVDPIKPTLKAPGSERLKVEQEKLLSNFAFKFNLRLYTQASAAAWREQAATEAALKKVEWCRLILSNPVLKPSTASAIETIYDELLSNVAFKLNLRRFKKEQETAAREEELQDMLAAQAGAYTRVHFGPT